MKAYHRKNNIIQFETDNRSAQFPNPENLTPDELLARLRTEASTDRPTFEEWAAAAHEDPLSIEAGQRYRRLHRQTQRLRKLLGGSI